MSSVLGGDDKGTNVRSIHTIFNQQKMLGNMTLSVFFFVFCFKLGFAIYYAQESHNSHDNTTRRILIILFCRLQYL